MGTTVILARWKGHWVLAQHVNLAVTGCSLMLPRSDDRFASEQGFHREAAYNHKHFSSACGIRFFPESRWRGSRIVITGWSHLHKDKAVLSCVVGRDWIDPASWFGRPGITPVQIGAAELHHLCAELGWSYDIRDEIGYRFCTVDELELIEGPPPEGAF